MTLRTSDAFIQLRHVHKIYDVSGSGVAALSGVTFDVHEGESIALLGSSGAGKSSLLNLLGGLERASAGQVIADGMDLTLLAPGQLATYRRRTVAMVWQHARLNVIPYLTVEENLKLPLALGRANAATADRRLLALSRLEPLRDRRPGSLSGGEQQLLAIGVALAGSPRLLLLDEPTAQLDASATEQVVDFLRSLRAADSTTLIVATHDTAVADALERTIHLSDGRVRHHSTRIEVDPDGALRLPPVMALAPASQVEVSIGDEEIHIRRLETTSRVTASIASARARHPATGSPTGPTQQAPEQVHDRAEPPILLAKNLTRSFGATTPVNHLDLDLALRPGDLQLLVGPSGSGKTTVISLLAGLDEPDHGSIQWLGREIRSLSESERRHIRTTTISVITQSVGLFPTLSAAENVALQLLLAGTAGDTSGIATDWLTRLGLGDHLDHRIHELSAGQQHRVGVARALALNPKIILADEPTANLDHDTAELVLSLLQEHSAAGNAILIATHDPLALPYATHVIRMR